MIRAFAFLFFVLIALFLYAMSYAKAHEWYPPWCCSGGDCGVLEGKRVKPIVGGYLVDDRFTVPMSEVRKSMDGRYHGCFPKADELKCFFAPPPGV